MSAAPSSGPKSWPRPTRACERDGVELARVEARLDVEREHAQARGEVGGPELGVAVNAPDAGAALERPLDPESTLHATIDQVAVGEAQVGLEALDAGVA